MRYYQGRTSLCSNSYGRAGKVADGAPLVAAQDLRDGLDWDSSTLRWMSRQGERHCLQVHMHRVSVPTLVVIPAKQPGRTIAAGSSKGDDA